MYGRDSNFEREFKLKMGLPSLSCVQTSQLNSSLAGGTHRLFL